MVVFDDLATWATGGEAWGEPQAASASPNRTSPLAPRRRYRLVGSRRSRDCCWFMGGGYEKTDNIEITPSRGAGIGARLVAAGVLSQCYPH
jgi:hypothetical protein